MISAEFCEQLEAKISECDRIPQLVGRLGLFGTGTHSYSSGLTVNEVSSNLLDQLAFANAGYRDQVVSINILRANSGDSNIGVQMADESRVRDEFSRKLDEWTANGVLTVAAEALNTNPKLKFTLIARPGTEVNAEEIIGLTRERGVCRSGWVKNRHAAHANIPAFSEDLLRMCSPEEISGKTSNDANAVDFELIPNMYGSLLYGSFEQQKAILGIVGAYFPQLTVPSLMAVDTLARTMILEGDVPEILPHPTPVEPDETWLTVTGADADKRFKDGFRVMTEPDNTNEDEEVVVVKFHKDIGDILDFLEKHEDSGDLTDLYATYLKAVGRYRPYDPRAVGLYINHFNLKSRSPSLSDHPAASQLIPTSQVDMGPEGNFYRIGHTSVVERNPGIVSLA